MQASTYAALHNSLAIAVKALRRNKLQTVLTMVGMTIGVATVLTMIALGSGAQAAIQTQVRAAGMNVIVVTAGNYKMRQQWTSQGEAEEPAAYHPIERKPLWKTAEWRGPHSVQAERIVLPQDNPIQQLERGGQNEAGRGGADTLSLADADAVAALSGVQNVSGGVADNARVTLGDASWFTRVHGEGAGLPSIRRAWSFPRGAFFTPKDVTRAADVAVLGSVVSEKLFGTGDPTGKTVEIRGRPYKVVGVIGSSSWMVPANIGDDQFDAIYIPVTSAESLLDRKGLGTLTVSTASTGDVTRVSKSITALLRKRHGLSEDQPDDFIVASQAHKALAKGGMRTDIARAVVGNTDGLDRMTLEQLGKTLEKASRTMTALLASIATVSLIVGGIGIMNIMLLAVTERTREIGIRRAVGARSSEVMLQFLMEAITLSLSGGTLGMLAGLGASLLIARFVHWSTSISPLAVALSFGVSAIVGILFGYYPAREASRVTPMTSLRYE